ncbi:ArsR family transcriptional regulator [Cetobacterium ceti]|uniref:ArsR family transcriptional regulator n=1 Tax=Cetobacterium ceti TaxID=180163 RepID=A0A1T4ME30_9FUSO|nr:metalloregulator ArsR/SmtB family transcription factor [Cetobacterium ceti]SJZ65141.1 ArsR family transcriptional regulator [Cetobacterium ceti]
MEKESKILKAMGHPLRLEIIQLLSENGDMCVCKIQEKFKSSQSNLSQHLKILKEAGILESTKVGGWVHYNLKNKDVINIINILKEI